MPIEIEHKYLVNAEEWSRVIPEKSITIKQGYIHAAPDKTVRVRTKADKGYITIKGKTVGASRPEFEYDIPLADAQELLINFCSQLIEKTRHLITYDHKTWEVDVFEGLNAGLIVAEIELKDERELYQKPTWIGADVTMDVKYSNAQLASVPYSQWV